MTRIIRHERLLESVRWDNLPTRDVPRALLERLAGNRPNRSEAFRAGAAWISCFAVCEAILGANFAFPFLFDLDMTASLALADRLAWLPAAALLAAGACDLGIESLFRSAQDPALARAGVRFWAGLIAAGLLAQVLFLHYAYPRIVCIEVVG